MFKFKKKHTININFVFIEYTSALAGRKGIGIEEFVGSGNL